MKTKFALLAGAIQIAACAPEALSPQSPVVMADVKCDLPNGQASKTGTTAYTWMQVSEGSVYAMSSQGTPFAVTAKGCDFNAVAPFPVKGPEGTLQGSVTSFKLTAGAMPGDKEIAPTMTFVKDGVSKTVPAPKGIYIVGRQ